MGQDIGKGLVIAMTVAGVFLALLPLIISETRSRKILQVAALLLSVIACAGFLGSILGGYAGLLLLPVSAACWFAGLFCGLACWLDATAERRAAETTFRLLRNDARGLSAPKGLKAPQRQDTERFTRDGE